MALAATLLQAGPDRPRDEAFKMIDAYIVSNLQESLDLTDDQFVKVLPLVKRLQTDRRAVVQRRQQALMELRRLLASGDATEARVKELLAQVKAAEADEPGVLRKDRDAIDAVLSPVQQAKFRVLEVEVEHKIRELMTQIRTQRRNQQKPRPGGPRSPEQ
jgi:Spy/CpxP family protein refolding chaperone